MADVISREEKPLCHFWMSTENFCDFGNKISWSAYSMEWNKVCHKTNTQSLCKLLNTGAKADQRVIVEKPISL